MTCGVRFFLFDKLRLLAQDDDFHSDRRLDHEQHEFVSGDRRVDFCDLLIRSRSFVIVLTVSRLDIVAYLIGREPVRR
ncbi:hypothetical protein A9O66_12745 [Paraburkholderia caribensis]|uniref:Uncharacterized protein n=1 Tax=Paraburkholderia caribensis TaxID=75105 RepID=A0A9Q6S246_9BURK|nr:hypothetical protein A9O66_12745 [Paraburkholderia caribensis]